MKVPRTTPPRRTWRILAVLTALFAVVLAAYDAPGDENIVADTLVDLVEDEAYAGTQFRMKCTIPSDIGDGLGGKSGTGTSSRQHVAIERAFHKAVQNKKGKNWRAKYDGWSGEVTIQVRKSSKKPWRELYAFDGPSHCVDLNAP